MLLRLIILTGISLFTSGCGSTPGAAAPPANTASVPSTASAEASKGTNVAACRALSNEEVLAVQGEMVSETKGNDNTSGGLAVSHCVYLLPTYSKSLSLDIMRAASSKVGNNAVEKFWETRFAGSEKERERDADEARGARAADHPRGEREEEEMQFKPRPVSGIGDEAFWVGSGVKGALYVRQGDAVLILSIGGAEAESARIKKTTLLAQDALKRVH